MRLHLVMFEVRQATLATRGSCEETRLTLTSPKSISVQQVSNDVLLGK